VTSGRSSSEAQLLRKPYESLATAEVQMPVWIFHGGRDLWVKPQWIYKMANALEQAGCSTVCLTIHEDRGHNSWTRVYAGEDLHLWFLAHERAHKRE